MRLLPSAFALLCPLVLAGCPDPRPQLTMSAYAERLPDGAVKVSGTVGNAGYEDYEGVICMTARWVRGAQVEEVVADDGSRGRQAVGGELVDEASGCVDRDLEPDQEAYFELVPPGRPDGDDLVIEVSLWQRANVETQAPPPPDVIDMPPRR